MRLQALQKAAVPAPRAVAELVGLQLDGELGDAVVLEAIEPAVSMDQYITKLLLEGSDIPDRRKLAEKIYELLHRLGKAKLGHNDLHMGNILLKNGEIYLLDAYAVRFSGLTTKDVMGIAHGVSRVATRTDLMRGWKKLEAGVTMPRKNTIAPRLRRKFLERTSRENNQFGLLEMGDWSGVYFKRACYPRRWGPASQMTISRQDWETEWPRLWGQIESGQMEVLKSSLSGDVLAGEITLGGQRISIVVKRPFRRALVSISQRDGAKVTGRRVAKSLGVVAPTFPPPGRFWFCRSENWLHHRRRTGLSAHDRLDTRSCRLKRDGTEARDMLFRRTARSFGESTTRGWDILTPRALTGSCRQMRNRAWPDPHRCGWHSLSAGAGMGLGRLIRSLELHPQHDPADVLALRQGYAPFSRFRDKGQ